jgi:hypothetical protein
MWVVVRVWRGGLTFGQAEALAGDAKKRWGGDRLEPGWRGRDWLPM